jgi:serine protease inhibitor
VALLVLLSAEVIQVEWTNQFTGPVGLGGFKNIQGNEVDAHYVNDEDRRRDVGYATITGVNRYTSMTGIQTGYTTTIAEIVEIPCKHDGRSMLLLLPSPVGLESLDMAMEGLYQHIRDNNGLQLTSESVDIMFPRFKGTVGPISIIPNLKKCGLEAIFDVAQTPFDATLTVPNMDPAVVGKVMHFASFAADENGAEAKAVTVASVTTYRSLSAPQPSPIKFYCDRPFIAIIGKKMHSSNGVSTWNFEFGMKITGSDSLDTSEELE